MSSSRKSYSFECPYALVGFCPVWRIPLPATCIFGLGSSTSSLFSFVLSPALIQDAIYRTRLYALTRPAEDCSTLILLESEQLYNEEYNVPPADKLSPQFNYTGLPTSVALGWLHTLARLCEDERTQNASHVYLYWT